MFTNHEKQLKAYIDSSKRIISSDGLKAVKHYYEHDEYEMSFEGLVIELIQSDSYPDDFNYVEWEKLALHYGLDTDSVFIGDFWDEFVKWGKSK